MQPFVSGKYVVGNWFLLDRSTGKVTFHCRSSMELLRQQLQAEDSADAAPGDGGQLTEADRLSVWAPAVTQILSQHKLPDPPAGDPPWAGGCQRSREDPFWGTNLARQRDADQAQELGESAAEHAQGVLTATRVEVTIRTWDFDAPPQEQRKPRIWTASDEELYQQCLMWECAVAIEFPGG